MTEGKDIRMKTNRTISKSALITMTGFAISMVMCFADLPVSGTVRNIIIISGIVLIYLGILLSRKDSPYLDNSKASALADALDFDLVGNFKEYKKVLSAKDKNGNYHMYSAWKAGLLNKYNRYGEETPDKKKAVITDDIAYYLRDIKRGSEDKADLFKSIMVPAEFGIVASIYELDLAPLTGEACFAAVIFLSVALCVLFAVEIKARNKIITFVGDFCEVLGIPV